MASIVKKYQKCGKSNCKCNTGEQHGPYLWRVTYIPVKQRINPNTKYTWEFLGKGE